MAAVADPLREVVPVVAGVAGVVGVEVLVLGPVRARKDGAELPLRGARERGVLAALALAGPSGVDIDRLVELVWGERSPATAARTAAAYLSRLRATLGPASIATRAARHRLVDVSVDLWEFDDLSGHGALVEALSLWRGSVAATDATLDGAAVELGIVARRRLDVMERLLAFATPSRGVEVAEAIVTEDPFREGAWLALAQLQHQLGRRADALHTVRRARSVLVTELGIDPSPQLLAVQADILSEDAQPTRLPAALVDLVGRDELSREVDDLVRRRRLVTLTGPGGIGKTSLALAVARGVAGDGIDSRPGASTVLFAPLAASASGTDVGRTLREAAGEAAPSSTGSVAQAFAARFRSRQGLLVVDSCEHVLPAVALLIADLLAVCPNLRVLATSRVALGVAGEVTVTVPPLPLPAVGSEQIDKGALRLFHDRVVEADPAASWTPADLEAAGDICRALDGIPLAVELAARQLRYRTIGEVRAALVDPVVSGGGQEWQVPFESVLLRSYDLLGAPTREAFRRLGQLRGPVPFDVASDIAGAGPLVRSLVDASLLVTAGGTVSMYEPIRLAAARLVTDPIELESIRADTALAITSLAERAADRLIGPDEVVWLTTMHGVHADVIAALQWADRQRADGVLARLAAAVGFLWSLGWGVGEGEPWVARSLERSPEGPHRPILLLWSSLFALRRGRPADAMAHANQAMAAARAHDNERVRAAALHLAGLAQAQSEGSAMTARRSLQEAFEVRRAIGDVAGAAMSFGALADLDVRIGDLESAARRYGIGLPLMRSSGSERGLLAYLHSIAELEVHLGHPARAEELVAEALPIARHTQDLWHVALLAVVAATAARQRGADPATLTRLARVALAACADQTDPVVLLDGVDVVAGILLDTGRADVAGAIIRASVRLREAQGLPISHSRKETRDLDAAATRAAGGSAVRRDGVEEPVDLDWLVMLAESALR